MDYEYLIIGAGIYGLYAADQLGKKGVNTAVIEYENRPFTRASYINQARVHNGYHYPRSFSTAIKSSHYFNRFCKDFGYAINNSFQKIYAISSRYSYTSARQFESFCHHAGISCDELPTSKFFLDNSIEAAYETTEYAFDAKVISDNIYTSILAHPEVRFFFNSFIKDVKVKNERYHIILNNGEVITTANVINTTYASVNQINRIFGFEPFKIKYEIAEVIICNVSDNLKNIGITVMDGPFFSVMPFGLQDTHTITSVTFTPHMTSYHTFPKFDCQKRNNKCTEYHLENCNSCHAKPRTSWKYMNQMSKKYLKSEYKITYKDSLFAIKPILKTSELDDSRPTVIRQYSKNPNFFTVLSGKINTMYDLDGVLI